MQLPVFLAAVLVLLGSVEPNGVAPDLSPSIVAVTAEGPEMTSQISERFGHSSYCTILKNSPARTTSVLEMDPIHTGVDLGNELIELKVSVVITGKIGPNALGLLRTAEVRVVQGVSGTVEEALKHFESGRFD